MDTELLEKSGLIGLGTINVLLGRNGSGKSRLLRRVDQVGRETGGKVKYITPERGGEWQFNSSVEGNLKGNPDWGCDVRRVNRFEMYRQLALAEFTALEIAYYRRSELEQKAGSQVTLDFDSMLKKINSLLENVMITRPDSGGSDQQSFPVVLRSDETVRRDFMSSGESEAVALAAEIVAFAHQARSVPAGQHLLFIDEPDVHLHPDLQYKLMALLIEELKTTPKLRVVIATHSTAIVAALTNFDDARVGFMIKNATSVEFREITSVIKQVLPIFGAHPLSSVFNESPILLVEGEDEERMWQQVVRTSSGSIKLWPCAVGGVGNLPAYERTVNDLATAIYDAPVAYSLRDKDDAQSELQDMGITRRMRLNCRASENLLLTNDVLRRRNTSRDTFKTKLNQWITSNAGHPNHVWMLDFQKGGYDRRNADLKEIRNIIVAALGATRSWEVIVGQAIGSESLTGDPHSLGDYLGPKMFSLLKR